MACGENDRTRQHIVRELTGAYKRKNSLVMQRTQYKCLRTKSQGSSDSH